MKKLDIPQSRAVFKLDVYCPYLLRENKKMQCFSGIQLETGYMVPCGQCMSCRINRGRKWTARLLLEQAFHPYRSWFTTLTYSPEHVPKTDLQHETLDKTAALKWVNNTKQRIGGDFRYFIVGEYGDRTYRPHYHMAVFPDRDCQITDVLKRWTYGFTSHYEMDQKRAAYLCHYTAKKLTKADDSRLQPDMEPEFRASSRVPPIGSAALPALVHPYRRGVGAKLLEERGDIERSVRIGGKVYPLDEFMLRKMREALGIPLTHTERMAHPHYLLWHETQEAQWEPEIHRIREKKIAKRKELRQTITASI